MNPVNLLQLADDTVIIAEGFESLCVKFRRVLLYSKNKFLEINCDKTKYMHMSNSPNMSDIDINYNVTIHPVKPKDGYTWLGFVLSYSNDIHTLVEFNLKKKKFNEAKFYSWLQVNEFTPFPLKLRVLYGCMFSAMLYSCEAWGDIEHIAESLLVIERKALKSCLGVKQGTSNDIIYAEVNKADIISVIKHRQYSFYKKFKNLSIIDAVACQMWNIYENVPNDGNPKRFFDYYNSLIDNSTECNKNYRISKLSDSTKSMDIRYKIVCNMKYNDHLYNSMINDQDRTIVSRWRLSSHKLYIETGRYKRPIVDRCDRKCRLCEILEDEYHALFICKAHIYIRLEFHNFLMKYNSVYNILNPSNVNDIKKAAEYIRRIEKNMFALKMCQ